MPKILQLSSRLPQPLDDGGRIATWNLSRCLHHNGYDIDLICYARDRESVADYREELARVFASVAAVPRYMERQYPLDLAHAVLTRTSYFVRKFWTRRYARLVRDRLDAHRYAATLIDGAFMGVYLPLVRRAGAAAGKVVLRAHNVEYEILERLAEREPRASYRLLLRREARHFRSFELKLVNAVDEVRTITARDAETFRAAGVDNRVRLLNAFIDVDNYQRDPNLGIEKHSIVHVGNMAWMPNSNGINWFLREVWPEALRRYPDSRFYIVGKNPSPSLQRLAGDHVVVTGYVDDEKPFIQRAHLFIVPLFEGSGVRIKILTAMAMGKVSLSTTIGAEGIDWPGLLIRDTTEAWIAAISEQFEGTPEYSEDAIQYIRDHYDWRRRLQLEDDDRPTEHSA